MEATFCLHPCKLPFLSVVLNKMLSERSRLAGLPWLPLSFHGLGKRTHNHACPFYSVGTRFLLPFHTLFKQVPIMPIILNEPLPRQAENEAPGSHSLEHGTTTFCVRVSGIWVVKTPTRNVCKSHKHLRENPRNCVVLRLEVIVSIEVSAEHCSNERSVWQLRRMAVSQMK